MSPFFYVGSRGYYFEKREMKLFSKLFRKKEPKKKMDLGVYDISITMKGIMLWEKLFNGNFFKIEAENIISLVYCLFIVCNPKVMMTYKTFMGIMENNEDFSDWSTRKLGEIMAYMSQFQENEETEGEEQGENKTMTITDMATSLIVDYGVDANYVMYKMGVWEIGPLYKAAESAVKRRYEENRLWTYIKLLPSMDSKKSMSPEQLLPFPWEVEELKNKQQDDLAMHTQAVLGLFKKKEDNGEGRTDNSTGPEGLPENGAASIGNGECGENSSSE